MNQAAWLGRVFHARISEDEPGRALRLATIAYVLGVTAQATYLFYFAPVALKVAGIEGMDRYAFAASAFLTMLTVLPAGRFADRHPRRWGMRVGLGLLAASYVPLFALPGGLAPVVLASALSGTGLAYLFVSFNSYVADLMSKGEMSKAYGNTGALSVLASATGPFVAAQVFRLVSDEAVGLRVNAALFLLVGLTGLALTMRLPTARGFLRAQLVPSQGGEARGMLAILAGMYLVIGLSYGLTLPYFSVYFLRDLAVGSDTWGLVLAAATACGALGFWLAGRLAQRAPLPALLLGGQAVAALAVVAFLFPLALGALVAAFLARHLFGSTLAPLVNTLMMGRVGAASRGQAQGWVSAAWNLGWASGALAGGALLGLWGGALFPVGGAIAALGAGLAVVLLRALDRSPRAA